jgi:hypothetical protein
MKWNLFVIGLATFWCQCQALPKTYYTNGVLVCAIGWQKDCNVNFIGNNIKEIENALDQSISWNFLCRFDYVFFVIEAGKIKNRYFISVDNEKRDILEKISGVFVDVEMSTPNDVILFSEPAFNAVMGKIDQDIRKREKRIRDAFQTYSNYDKSKMGGLTSDEFYENEIRTLQEQYFKADSQNDRDAIQDRIRGIQEAKKDLQ